MPQKEPWHNPIAPEDGDTPTATPTSRTPSRDYATDKDQRFCSFFLKVGACRFGDRCSRQHPRPTTSCTLLIPAMYSHLGLQEQMLNERDQDVALEHDEREIYEHFSNFFSDVLPEFSKAGKVVQFKVSCNHEVHLRGNVYVQYSTEEECEAAFQMFNGRWYAQKQLSCELCPIKKWKSAICGLFNQKRCPKGKNCNFLHVFPNPGGAFSRADRDLPPFSPPRRHSSSSSSSRHSAQPSRFSSRSFQTRSPWQRRLRSKSREERRSRAESRDRRERRWRRNRSESRERRRSRKRKRSESRERRKDRSESRERRKERSESRERRKEESESEENISRSHHQGRKRPWKSSRSSSRERERWVESRSRSGSLQSSSSDDERRKRGRASSKRHSKHRHHSKHHHHHPHQHKKKRHKRKLNGDLSPGRDTKSHHKKKRRNSHKQHLEEGTDHNEPAPLPPVEAEEGGVTVTVNPASQLPIIVTSATASPITTTVGRVVYIGAEPSGSVQTMVGFEGQPTPDI